MENTQLWKQKAGNIIVLGVTEALQEEMGEIAYVQIASTGSIKEGDSLLNIEASKSAIEIPSPINGTIISKNDEAEKLPELLSSPEQSDNWIVKIDVSDNN